jgi:hypothetical protein
MHIVPFFCHVKGHQDDKTAYGNLPLEAQLNVDADHEAGSYYQMHPHDNTPVWLIPGTCANLTINANTISSGYKQVIRTASIAPPLLAKIQECNGWTTHDMSLFHWTALGRATRQMPSRMIQILKLLHNLLPTAALVHRYDPKLPTSCMLCRHDHEDRDHILQYPHRFRHLWRHRLFAAIRNTGDQQRSRPALVALLIEGLDNWFRQSTVNPALIDECFHPLLKEQDHLGWRQIFNGQWSHKWAYLQDQYLLDIGNKDLKYTGASWLTAMLTTVWRQFFVVWSERNNTVHGNTHATRQQADLHQIITREIHQWLYCRDQLLQSGRMDILEAKFGPTIETSDAQINNDPPHVSLNCLRMYSPILHDGIKLATATAIQGVRRMNKYFPIIHQAGNKRPPKPRYSCKHHTRFDSQDRVRRKTQPSPNGTQSILPFFSQPNLPWNRPHSRTSPLGALAPGSSTSEPNSSPKKRPARAYTPSPLILRRILDQSCQVAASGSIEPTAAVASVLATAIILTLFSCTLMTTFEPPTTTVRSFSTPLCSANKLQGMLCCWPLTEPPATPLSPSFGLFIVFVGGPLSSVLWWQLWSLPLSKGWKTPGLRTWALASPSIE